MTGENVHVRRWRGSFTNASAWEWTWPTAGEMQRCAVSCNIPRRAGWGRQKQFLWKFHQPLLSLLVSWCPPKRHKTQWKRRHALPFGRVSHGAGNGLNPKMCRWRFLFFSFFSSETILSTHFTRRTLELTFPDAPRPESWWFSLIIATFLQRNDTDLLGTWAN